MGGREILIERFDGGGVFDAADVVVVVIIVVVGNVIDE